MIKQGKNRWKNLSRRGTPSWVHKQEIALRESSWSSQARNLRDEIIKLEKEKEELLNRIKELEKENNELKMQIKKSS